MTRVISLVHLFIVIYGVSAERRAGWRYAVRSSINHLLVTSHRGDVFLGEYDGKQFLPDAAHLTTFAPGNWLLGAALLDDEDVPRKALQLLDSAWATHDLSPCVSFVCAVLDLLRVQCRHGLGPDEYRVVPSEPTLPTPRRYRKQAEKLGLYCTHCG